MRGGRLFILLAWTNLVPPPAPVSLRAPAAATNLGDEAVRNGIATLLALAAAGISSAQTVTLTLNSSRAGQTVSPGTMIDWTISFTVSSGDNAGLALLACDITQDAANPATMDIPPATGVPAPMANFSRPAGIANPGESNPTTGYVGVQRGTPGAMNLLQVGGGQNTFGQALPPGTGIAESANVIGAVGQGGAEILAHGSFPAPSVEGTYVFTLANARANVVTTVNAPPELSPAVSAAVDTTLGSFSFTVGGGIPGDLDGDGDVDLTDLAVLLANFGTLTGATYEQGDIDGDGDVDLADLATLLANFGT